MNRQPPPGAWSMMHWRLGREMAVTPRADNLAVGVELTVEYDDRVGRAVLVASCGHPRRVADEVVLGSRGGSW
jgi:hypothetical protein